VILTYRNLFEEDSGRARIRATITTNHCADPRGQPVIVLEDGGVLDLMSWSAMDCQVESATKREREILEKMGLTNS